MQAVRAIRCSAPLWPPPDKHYYEGGAGREDWTRAVAELGVGGGFKDRFGAPGEWTIGGTAFGEMLPNHENKVTLDDAKQDKWGLPVLKIDCAIGENERLMRKDMMNDMAEMLHACGARDVVPFDQDYTPESIIDLHGAHGTRRRLRGSRVEAEQSVAPDGRAPSIRKHQLRLR